jgi:hypothetical protein
MDKNEIKNAYIRMLQNKELDDNILNKPELFMKYMKMMSLVEKYLSYEDMVDCWEYVELKNNWKDVEFPAKEKFEQDKLF